MLIETCAGADDSYYFFQLTQDILQLKKNFGQLFKGSWLDHCKFIKSWNQIIKGKFNHYWTDLKQFESRVFWSHVKF